MRFCMPDRFEDWRRLLFVFASVLVSAFVIWAVLVPPALNRQLEAVCRIDSRYVYVVSLPSGGKLSLSPERGMSAEADGSPLFPDSAWASGCFVSPSGHLITSAVLLGFHPDSIGGEALQLMLQVEKHRIDSLRIVIGRERRELDYYARKHSVMDDGYNAVMDYRASLIRRAGHVDTLSLLLESALAGPDLVARLETAYSVTYGRPDGKGRWLSYAFRADRTGCSDSLLLLRSAVRLLPQGAARFVPYWRPVATWGKHELGCFGLAFSPDVALPDSVSDWDSADREGVVSVNCFGKLCGIRAGGRYFGSAAVADLVYRDESWPVWLCRNIRDRVESWFSDASLAPVSVCPDTLSGKVNVAGYATVGRGYGCLRTSSGSYCGRVQAGVPDGLGTMLYTDGTRYSGTWLSGQRCGKGVFADAAGRIYSGRWTADTLSVGYLSDSVGRYCGGFDARFRRSGYGEQSEFGGTYYAGEWNGGKRHGFGFSVSADRIVHCGVWRRGRFQGERMVYTARRVYGIDISRYQHEVGKKLYAIDWQKLRVRRLSTALPRRVQGEQDYPVSFVYVKATQGVTVKNKYYTADVAAARKKGVATGAYHFFSTRMSGRAQAEYFLKVAAPRKGDLPPVLDVEPSDRQIMDMGGPEIMFREIVQWMRVVRRATGTVPVLYISQSFVNKYMSSAPPALADCPVWIARYGEYKPYVRLLYWQLSPDGRVDGIYGDVDINVYNGTLEQFHEYLREACVKK